MKMILGWMSAEKKQGGFRQCPLMSNSPCYFLKVLSSVSDEKLDSSTFESAANCSDAGGNKAFVTWGDR